MSSSLRTPGKHSPLWREWRQIGRGKDSRFFMEHRDAVLETLEADSSLQQVLLSRELWSKNKPHWEDSARRSQFPWYLLESQELNRLVSVAESSGLCGIYSPQPSTLEELCELDFLLLGWEIQDPGNLGALLRSCGGLAGGGVILLGGCHPWSSKVARASAGAIFRTPIATFSVKDIDFLLRELFLKGFTLYSTAPRHGLGVAEAQWSGKDVVILGNESHGLPQEIEKSTELLTLEMTRTVESLNVAIAGSIVCYEWKRCMRERSTHG